MQLISAERRKETSVLQASGISSAFKSFFRVNNPLPVGLSLSPSSLNYLGWAKSPVPITVMPFNCAHFQIFSGDMSGLVALEYLEWIWRSAMKGMTIV